MIIDGLQVRDETEAMVLMLHHLKLAARYFEATPTTYPHSFLDEEFSAPAVAAWLVEMERLYPEVQS
jgi:hypothetical protein